jgi:cytochrome d ubiquinol oxidase subunit I
VSKTVHYVSNLMVCLGAHLSAVWIVIANSWMHTPAGFHIVGEGIHRRVEITDFWAMVFNPSTVDRLLHVIVGAWAAGAFLVIGVSAYYLLKRRFVEEARLSLKLALGVGAIAVVLQLVTGDISARTVARHTPVKLAAYEGIFQTQKGAPLSVFGVVNSEQERVEYQVAVPKLLSLMTYFDPDAEIIGLDAVPPQDRPNVAVVFETYHLMVATWGMMVGLLSLVWQCRREISSMVWLLRLLVASAFVPQIGNQAGWVATEMARSPWLVLNVLRLSDGVSKSVQGEQIVWSILLFLGLYFFLFCLYLFLGARQLREGIGGATYYVR